MKVKLDDEVLFEIDELMISLLAHDIEDPLNDIKRRLRYIIEHKCDRCYERMHKEWTEKFHADPNVTSIPAKKRDFVNAVLAHPQYKNRVARDLEAKALEESRKPKEQ